MFNQCDSAPCIFTERRIRIVQYMLLLDISVFVRHTSVLYRSDWICHPPIKCYPVFASSQYGCEVLWRVCFYVCLCVCLSARITRKARDRTLPTFSACCPWSWLGPPVTELPYVMYFRFYGWRHCRAIMHDVIFMRSFPRGGRPTSRARATWRPASSQTVLLPRQPRTRDVGRARARQSTRGPS